ncbi:hypothetical protein TSAR_017057 [Trichomalopsis sarcophagae]|uniref:G-protein coupled receptors family 1 profile domain-containing protein n=1 Tax=Trichomalopsis sarcophagae TaxID=543379 RepID=A0A232FHX7_9HYME|nr:hypothetical protein TSAR_017057 [Trichomalopsis sarcophagae]
MSTFPEVQNSSNISSDFFKPDDDWPYEVRRYWLHLQPFVNLVRALLVYVTSFIIVTGVTLNVLSFVVLSSPVINDSSLSIYLRALAISDIGALVFNYATSIARSHSEDVNRLFVDNKYLCDTNAVTMELFQFTSTWLIVCLTWARLVAVAYPLGKHKNSSESSTLATIVILAIVSLTISLTKLYVGGYESDSVFEFAPCRKKPKPWASAMHLYIALSTWLPLIFIFFGNMLLIICVRRTAVIRSRLTPRAFKVNRTLLAVSLVHLILLLPLGVVETIEMYWDVVLVRYPSLDEQENELYAAEEVAFEMVSRFVLSLVSLEFCDKFLFVLSDGEEISQWRSGKFKTMDVVLAL